jgi:hypothetical protein
MRRSKIKRDPKASHRHHQIPGMTRICRRHSTFVGALFSAPHPKASIESLIHRHRGRELSLNSGFLRQGQCRCRMAGNDSNNYCCFPLPFLASSMTFVTAKLLCARSLLKLATRPKFSTLLLLPHYIQYRIVCSTTRLTTTPKNLRNWCR